MKRFFDIFGIWYNVAALLFSTVNFVITGNKWALLGFVVCAAALAFLLWTHFEYPKWRERRDQEMRAEFEKEMKEIMAEADRRIFAMLDERMRARMQHLVDGPFPVTAPSEWRFH